MKKELAKSDSIYKKISEITENARTRALYAGNTEMVRAYWLIGKEIVEEEQKGEERANYGEYLLIHLSKDLTKQFGRGFTERNLRAMRQFYLAYPKLHALRAESDAYEIRHALRTELTWTHFRILMRVENNLARQFYEVETIRLGGNLGSDL